MCSSTCCRRMAWWARSPFRLSPVTTGATPSLWTTACGPCSRASAPRWWRMMSRERAHSSPMARRHTSCSRPWNGRSARRWPSAAWHSREETNHLMSATTARPIAIYHEHPDLFRPLFQELDRRAVPYVRLDAASHRFDASDGRPSYALVFNRMSPSAYLPGAGNAIFYTLHYLAHLRRHGVRVINGYDAYVPHTATALQP